MASDTSPVSSGSNQNGVQVNTFQNDGFQKKTKTFEKKQPKMSPFLETVK